MVHDHNQWLGNMLSDTGEQIYLAWCRRIDSLTYNFTQDLGQLDGSFNRNFTAIAGDHPSLLSSYLCGAVSLETMVILDQILGYRKRWDKEIKETYVWPAISLKIKKYAPFLSVDKEKFRKIALDLITQDSNK